MGMTFVSAENGESEYNLTEGKVSWNKFIADAGLMEYRWVASAEDTSGVIYPPDPRDEAPIWLRLPISISGAKMVYIYTCRRQTPAAEEDPRK
jgi:hypothetical protein